MAEKIVMTALSPTMETGTIARWNKNVGDSITTGDLLCEVETDKATMDYESVNEGTLLKIVAEEGSRIKVGETIAIIGNQDEDISELLTESKVQKESKDVQPEKPSSAGTEEKRKAPVDTTPTKRNHLQEGAQLPGGVKASPLAREIARKQSIDLRTLQGSGPGGRILKDDVESALQQKTIRPSAEIAPSGLSGQIIPLSEKRRVIAQRLSQSMFSAPHFYLSVSVKADTLIKARNKLNSKRDKKISINAFLIKFTAEALRHNPAINAAFRQDSIERFGSVDIGIAVAQKDGLITPVVRNCTLKGIVTIDEELRELVQRARDGKLSIEEYTNATFTISNLGSWGVREFTAIINPPGSAILAVGELFREPVVNKDDEIEIQTTMILTLSCDHRVIDGVAAAKFAAELKEMLENPVSVLF